VAKQKEINPWLSMWTKPRETIRWIVKTNPNMHIWWLAGFYGLPLLLRFAQGLSLGQDLSIFLILIVSVIFAAPVGMLGFVVMSALVYWMGKWLGGAGNYASIRAAIAWSKMPNVVVSFLWLILMGLFGAQVFFETFPLSPFTGASYVIFSAVTLIHTVLIVWSFVLLFRALAEVQKYSVWKAIINVVLPFVVVAIALWELLVFIFWAIGMKG
jgi:hypothetical protein